MTDVAISPDGGTVAVTTRRPDASVHAYDTERGDSMWSVSPRRATPRLLGFHEGDEMLLYVSRERRTEPYLAIDSDGEIAWGNERYQSTRPFSERVRSFVSRE